ncbi:MAG: hypothetical protein WCE44_06980 [Candidatus Velthaea sp.]
MTRLIVRYSNVILSIVEGWARDNLRGNSILPFDKLRAGWLRMTFVQDQRGGFKKRSPG